ncbi:hypothetical protein DXG01_015429 [Tephrocybe rancida]|nr:hypothetical protein DXG01_015429 [Tephrocybe rancida]
MAPKKYKMPAARAPPGGPRLLTNKAIIYHLVLQMSWEDAMVFCQTSRMVREVVMEGVSGRQGRVLRCFFTAKGCAAFWTALQHTGGGKCGLVAWSIITPDIVLAQLDVPHDLNILVPLGQMEHWRGVMAIVGYIREEEMMLENALAAGAARRAILFRNGLSAQITIAESATQSVFTALARSVSTCQTTLVTPTTIYSMYPGLACQHRSVGIRTLHGLPTVAQLDSMERRLVKFLISTRYWKGECEEACPAKWRHSLVWRGMGVFRWANRDDTAEAKLQAAAFKWRIGDECWNPYCTYSSGKERLDDY